MDDLIAQVTRLVADEPARAGDRSGAAGTLRRLCSAAERSLAVSGVGVSVLAESGMRGVAAVSEPGYEAIAELQFTLGEGPCLDAYATREPVLVPELAGPAMLRWPGYAPACHDRGMRAVFAFPLQIGAARLGVLDVFRSSVGHRPDLNSSQRQKKFTISEFGYARKTGPTTKKRYASPICVVRHKKVAEAG